jgi:hypothetical protein
MLQICFPKRNSNRAIKLPTKYFFRQIKININAALESNMEICQPWNWHLPDSVSITTLHFVVMIRFDIYEYIKKIFFLLCWQEK